MECAPPPPPFNFRLRILYANVRGLLPHKIQELWARADDNTLVFAAETWHMDAGLAAHSDVLLATTPEARVRGVLRQGRRHGGLALWVGPRLRSLISNTQISPFSITVTIAGRVIHAVYMPPSTSSFHDKANSFRFYLTPPDRSRPDVLIGDINVRFGPAFDDHASGPTLRLRDMDAFCTQNSMTHLHPLPASTQRSYVDHMFIGPAVRGQYSTQKPDYVSDHPYMEASVQWDHMPSANTQADASVTSLDPLLRPSTRIRLKHLDTQSGRNALFWHWGRAYPKVRKSVLALSNTIDARNAQKVVNKVDRLIGTAVWDVAARALGTYEVSEAKRQPDYLAQGLESSPSAAAAIRLFRRAQRDSQTVLVSRQSDQVPVPEDVLAFYKDVYESSEPGLDTLPMRPALSGAGLDAALLTSCGHDAVVRAIQEYPVARSGGPDGMHHVLIKTLSSSGLSHLLSWLFLAVAQTGCTPDRWNTSLVHPIPKGAGLQHNENEAGVRQMKTQTIDKMRPISLTVMFRRLFEKCFLAALGPAETMFHPCQAGFRSGFSTTSLALVAHADAASGQFDQAFVDFKQAYDRVVLLRLFEKLQRRGMSAMKRAVLHSLFVGTRSYVNVNGYVHPASFQRVRGIFQGSLLAGFLFNVYIDDLPDYVQPRMPQGQTSVLLYADDVKMSAQASTDLGLMFLRLQFWCRHNGMQINVAKSGELIDGTRAAHAPIRIGTDTLPMVKSYTYLGFPHHAHGVDFVARNQQNFDRATAMTGYLAVVGRLWSPATRLMVYKTVARPLLDYGGALLWHTLYGRKVANRPTSVCDDVGPFRVDPKKWKAIMDQHHRRAVHWVTKRSTETMSVPVLGAVAGLVHPQDRLYKLAVQLREHMVGLDPSSVAVTRMRLLSDLPPEGTSWSQALIARAGSIEVLGLLPSEQGTRTGLSLANGETVHVQHRLRLFLQRSLTTGKQRLLRYMFDSARQPYSSSRGYPTEPRPDALLFHKENKVVMRAVEWRLNRFGARCSCLRCHNEGTEECRDRCPGHPFLRSCVDRCAEAYQVPLSPTDERLLRMDRAKLPEELRDKYHRPDAYLNRQLYKQFARLMLYIDGRIRHQAQADVLQEPQSADRSAEALRKASVAERHRQQDVDMSTMPEWVQPTDETEVGGDWSKVTPEMLMSGEPLPPPPPKFGPIVTKAPHPPGCLTKTYELGGHKLHNTVEQYASLGPDHFRPRLSGRAKADYQRLDLIEPSAVIRRLLKEELDRRANGQGFLYHNPDQNTVYNPAEPYKATLTEAEMRELEQREQLRIQRATEEALRQQEHERRLAAHLKHGRNPADWGDG